MTDCFFEEQKTEEKEYVSVNKLNLQQRHTLMRTIIGDNHEKTKSAQSMCGKSFYDIASKNHQFEKLRECSGHRIFKKERRREAMEALLSSCNMKEPEHIEQMIQTAADRKKPRITGTDITTRETNDRMARQRPKTAAVSPSSQAQSATKFVGWYENCRQKLKPENFIAIEQAKKRRD
jgi:hypothetical protein